MITTQRLYEMHSHCKKSVKWSSLTSMITNYMDATKPVPKLEFTWKTISKCIEKKMKSFNMSKNRPVCLNPGHFWSNMVISGQIWSKLTVTVLFLWSKMAKILIKVLFQYI